VLVKQLLTLQLPHGCYFIILTCFLSFQFGWAVLVWGYQPETIFLGDPQEAREAQGSIFTRDSLAFVPVTVHIYIHYYSLQVVFWMGFSWEIWHWWMYKIRCLEKAPLRRWNFLAVLLGCYFW
jgi:hypothetical protein